ncbi:LemA family protein [Vibrio breoganii]
MDVSIIILLVAVAVLVIVFCAIYNKLVKLKNRCLNSFAQIDVQLKKRFDLIPNLLNVCKGYMAHEKETFVAVVEARNAAREALESANSGSGTVDEVAEAEGRLNKALTGLNIAVEAYPELKADIQMTKIQEELTTCEEKIAFARQAYNDAVMLFNTQRQSLPTILIAGMIGYGEDEQQLQFEDREEIAKVPTVEF